jgi:hypothetical protein
MSGFGRGFVTRDEDDLVVRIAPLLRGSVERRHDYELLSRNVLERSREGLPLCLPGCGRA